MICRHDSRQVGLICVHDIWKGFHFFLRIIILKVLACSHMSAWFPLWFTSLHELIFICLFSILFLTCTYIYSFIHSFIFRSIFFILDGMPACNIQAFCWNYVLPNYLINPFTLFLKIYFLNRIFWQYLQYRIQCTCNYKEKVTKSAVLSSILIFSQEIRHIHNTCINSVTYYLKLKWLHKHYKINGEHFHEFKSCVVCEFVRIVRLQNTLCGFIQ